MSNNLNKIMDVLHGGIARYNQDTGKYVFEYCTDSIAQLYGCAKEELWDDRTHDALDVICSCDRNQAEQILRKIREKRIGLKAYFRIREEHNHIKWCRLDCWEDGGDSVILISGISPEIQLFRSVAKETADDIYVIEKDSFNLLYANNLKEPYFEEENQGEQKCYQVLHGKSEPCEFCELMNHNNEDMLGEKTFENEGRFYITKLRETDWSGRPSYIKYVRDITEEVENNRQKERLEQYFQTVVKYLPGGMAVVHHEVDGELKPEYLSEGFSEMLDMPKDEAWRIYRDNALSGVHPDDREYVKTNLDQCIKEKRQKYELQYRLKKGNGDYIWINAKFSVIQCDGGDARVYVNYHDITAEKKMQDQLRQQYKDQLHQHYMMAGPDALILGHCNITKNKIYEIVDYTNSQLLERFGDVREEFFFGIGTFIEDEAEREAFYEKYLNEPSMEAYLRGEKEIIHPCFFKLPGKKIGSYVQFKVTLLEAPDTGDVTGILTVTDITEKIIREKIFMQMSSTNYDLVANVNLFKDTYEIVSGGDEIIREKRGTNTERIRRVLEEMVASSSREREYVESMLNPEKMLERLKKKKSYSFTYSIRDTRGKIRTKNMVISDIDLRLGRVCFVRADVTDVLKAERRAKEELERALSEAKKASRVKSDFLSSMSHDIRTPMNAIVGMTTLALANLDNRDKVEDYLHKISVSSQHLLSLLNDILDMSQIEQSKIHLNYQTIQIEELLNHISSIMTSPAENAGLKFQIQMGEFQHTSFSGDPLRIKQILINLLSNAIKFTMEGGAVLFRTEEIPAEKEHHVRYCFTVQDTGIGMSEEFISHLFEPFIRSSQVVKVEGTGLGLSITKGLVDLMGGAIRVESRQREGTRFEIELEFERVEMPKKLQESADTEVEDEDLSGYHFLLVEDNEINSEILGELLMMRGAAFKVVTDGQQAVNEFKRAEPGTYDAIFMDIQMPVMNGYEATRKIRSLDHPDAKSVIILAMTANAFAEDVKESIEAGMNGHIAKPVDMTLLYNTISSLLPSKTVR